MTSQQPADTAADAESADRVRGPGRVIGSLCPGGGFRRSGMICPCLTDRPTSRPLTSPRSRSRTTRIPPARRTSAFASCCRSRQLVRPHSRCLPIRLCPWTDVATSTSSSTTPMTRLRRPPQLEARHPHRPTPAQTAPIGDDRDTCPPPHVPPNGVLTSWASPS